MTNVTSTVAGADALGKSASTGGFTVSCGCFWPYDVCGSTYCYRSSRCFGSDLAKEADASSEIPATAETQETAEAQNKPDVEGEGSAKESGGRRFWSCWCLSGHPYCSRHVACYRTCFH